MSSFRIVNTLGDALAALANGARPIAGGSDLVVGARHGKFALPDNLVAIDRIDGLDSIVDDDAGLSIGATATHAQLMVDPLVIEHATAIADGAALVGSPATRNVGTLGGNIMNGSPAMDTGAGLIVLGASAILQRQSGERSVPVAELWTGPGATVAADDELCTSVEIPASPGPRGSAYVRLEYRRSMEIAVVGAAAAVTLDGDGAIGSIRVALAAVAPTIIEVEHLGSISGMESLDEGTLARIATSAAAQARPISDVRASDDYRRHMVGVMATRAVDAAHRRATGEAIAVPVNRAVGVGR